MAHAADYQPVLAFAPEPFHNPLTLYRPGSEIQCPLCGGRILRDELYSRLKVGEGDGRRVVPVCRDCVPFHVVELLD